MVAVGVVTASYTAYGGLPASLETDKIQAWAIMFLITTLLLILFIGDINSLISDAKSYTPEDIDTMSFEILTMPRIFTKNSKIFMLTQKNSGQYLDFVGYSKTGGNIVNYSKRTMNQVIHCGDRVSDVARPTDPTVFIHAMSINPTVTDCVDFTIGGVGYSKTPLMSATFMNQKPSMCCYDSSNNTTYIITL